MLSKQRKELLFYGYVREQYDMQQIPDEIMLLFMQWWSNRYYINISGDLMKEFLSAEDEDAMEDVHNIQINDDISIITFYLTNVHIVCEMRLFHGCTGYINEV